MSRPRRHHLISVGYQRHWSRDGRRIVCIDKQTLQAKPIGMRDAFCRPNLLSFEGENGRDAALEVEFGRLETRVLPQVRRFCDGERDDMSEMAVRSLVALHWARGEATIGLMRRIAESVGLDLADQAEDDIDLRRAFVDSEGREPHPGELREHTVAFTAEFRESNEFFVARVQYHYEQALERWTKLHSQRVTLHRPSRARFVFADAPVVLTHRLEGSAESPIALDDASTLWMPLGPTVAVFLTTSPEEDEVVIPPETIQFLNQRTWGWARRFVAAGMGDSLDLAFGWKPGTILRTGRWD